MTIKTVTNSGQQRRRVTCKNTRHLRKLEYRSCSRVDDDDDDDDDEEEENQRKKQRERERMEGEMRTSK